VKRSGFKPKSLAEIRAKQAEKRKAAPKVPKVKKKPAKRQKTANKKKSKTQAQLKKELDKYFSLYIRTTHSDENGNNTCYTCGKAGTIKTMQCGHFVSRQYLATRWHENNCRIQCAGCNLFGNGKPLDFEERLKKELGDEYVEEMKASRHQSLKLDRHWYQEQIEKYKNLI
jgi:hypothetical protein